ncbi:hypothetical protein [Tunturiibacter gelidiferens]|uniref:hypothetical protein n=1 Tax=Tunturiibacter gelidiferens TaxID=3069689 RepID=UPI003D9B6F7F
MNANQNALVVIGDSISTSSLNSDHVRELMQFSRATGYSLSTILNRAAENWLAIEAPVYLAHAREAQSQRV